MAPTYSQKVSSEPAQPTDAETAAAPATSGERQLQRVRRAPRYRPFVLTGAVVGLLVAALVIALHSGPTGTSTGGVDAGRYSQRQLFLYLGLGLAVLGGLLGGAVALLVERAVDRSRRR